MSSGKGAQQGTKHVNGTIPCLIGLGPLYAIDAILLNGESVWTGPLLRQAASNPVNLSTKYGTIRLYWGTEEQPADPLLNQYEEHPPYRGLAYVVFVDFDHGQSTSAYNAEFIVRGGVAQTLVPDPAGAENLDDSWTVNPIAHAVELLTSPEWLGLPAAALVVDSFVAVAGAVQGEAPSGSRPDRSASAVSPLYADATDLRSALAALGGMADAWFRITASGLIECGRWARGYVPASVTSLKHDDLTDLALLKFDSAEEAPNSYAVEFTDSEALHKDAKLAVDDQAGIVDAGRLVRKTLKADWLITADQAMRAGQEALRRATVTGTWSGSVRWGKAVTPTGERLQPGDYIRVPLTQPGEAVQAYQLIRVTKVTRPKDATGAVAIEGEIEPPAAPKLGTVIHSAGAAQPGLVLPPVIPARVLALPALIADRQPGVYVFATRSTGLAAGIHVYYDDSIDGDFPLVGRQPSFALPVSLVTSTAADAATIRVALLEGTDGADLQRDSAYLRNWVGGATEGRNDELLVILLAKDANGAIIGTASTQQVEVLSIAGAPTLVEDHTFDIPVLRGRQGTAALAYTTGSFPDAWVHYEGWIIPRYSLAALSHADFAAMLSSGTTGYFRLGAYAGSVQYSPAAAYAERTRRADAELALAEYGAQVELSTWIPTLSTRIPTGLYRGLAATGVSVDNTTNGLESTTVQSAINELADRPTLPEDGSVGQSLVRTAAGTAWADSPSLSDSGSGVSLIASTPFGLRRLVAGTGVTLALIGGAIEISAEGGGSGAYNGPPGYSATAFAGIPDGMLGSDSTGWGWAGDAVPYVAENPTCVDNFAGIASGTITSWDGGTGWTGSATPYIAENPTSADNFASIPTGTITSWSGGTGWTGAATPYVP